MGCGVEGHLKVNLERRFKFCDSGGFFSFLDFTPLSNRVANLKPFLLPKIPFYSLIADGSYIRIESHTTLIESKCHADMLNAIH